MSDNAYWRYAEATRQPNGPAALQPVLGKRPHPEYGSILISLHLYNCVYLSFYAILTILILNFTDLCVIYVFIA